MPTMKNRVAEMNAAEKKKPRESSFEKSKRDIADNVRAAKSSTDKPKLSTTESYRGSFKGGIMRVDKALQDAGVD